MLAAGVERGRLHDVTGRLNHNVTQVRIVTARDLGFLPRRNLMAHQPRSVGAN